MHQTYLAAIKTFEGFTPQARWDYAQHSNGYGTKALYPGEAISPQEAERRFAAEIAIARDIVEKHAPGWDEGTKAALTSLTFNAGTKWISAGLGEAVRSGDIEAVRDRFVQYTKAQGEVLPGLLRRRLAEVDWIGNGPQAAGVESQAAAAIKAAATQAHAAQTAAANPAPVQLAMLQPTRDVEASPAVHATDPDVLAPAGQTEAVAALRDRLAGLTSGDVSEARNAQSASMLIELLFELQMSAASNKHTEPGHAAGQRTTQTV